MERYLFYIGECRIRNKFNVVYRSMRIKDNEKCWDGKRGVYLWRSEEEIILTFLCYGRCIKSGWGLLKVKVNPS